MNFYDNLKQVCDEKGIKITPTVLSCGGTKGVLGGWKKGILPNSEIVMNLSVLLNVPTDKLLFGKEKSPTLPEDELELLKYYKELPEKEQMKLIGRASALAEVYKEQVTQIIEVETPMIEIRHSIYKVSAGTGYNLDDGDQWDTIEIPDTPEANKADFALTISGDSMEPVYYDGDIVLIKSQPAISNGEIGIFIIENDGYIKKYGGNRLISLNAAYDDIMFSDYDPDNIRCVGLVIGRV